MPIYLPPSIEAILKSIAAGRGESVETVVVDALRRYLESASITDVTDAELAQTQVELMRELDPPEPWDEPGAGDHATR